MERLAERRTPLPAWEAIRAPFEAFAARADGRWVEPPLLQPLSRLLDFAGEALRARLFVVSREDGDELCLRPDFTLPVALTHLESGEESGRYVYEGLAFRTAPPGSGRASEFRQIGAELYGGEAEPARVDGEVLTLALQAATAGGRDDLALTLGDVGLFSALLEAIGLPSSVAARLIRALPNPRSLAAELARAREGLPAARAGGRLPALLAGLAEAEATQVLEELWALADIRPVGGRSPAEIVHRLTERAHTASAPRLGSADAELIERYLRISGPVDDALEAVAQLAHEAGVDLGPELDAWGVRLGALEAAGVVEADGATLATAFARAFAYYDGMLFEVSSAALGPDQPVAAGGRYDGLLARLGAPVNAAGGGRAVGCVVRPGRAWDGGVR